MKLQKLIDNLKQLAEQGHGDKEVFYRHGSSGDCGPLGSARVTDEVGECGPFDIEDGEQYISIYAGN